MKTAAAREFKKIVIRGRNSCLDRQSSDDGHNMVESMRSYVGHSDVFNQVDEHYKYY